MQDFQWQAFAADLNADQTHREETMNIEIDVAALLRDIEQLYNYLDRFGNHIESLSSCIQSLSQTWEGTAKDAYLAQFHTDELQIRSLYNTITEYLILLEYAAKEYQNCEEKVQAEIAQITV